MAAAIFVLALLSAAAYSDGASIPEYDTIVVGLGAAGVTAATTLARAGKRVLGLEALDRFGGRVHTVQLDDGVVEIGAEWIHGTVSSRVYELAVQNNISTVPQKIVYKAWLSEGGPGDSELIEDLMENALPSPTDARPENLRSLGEYFTWNIMNYIKEKKPELLDQKEKLKQILDSIAAMENANWAINDWNDFNAHTIYEDLGGELEMSWSRYGYKTYFEIMLNKYNNGVGLPTLETKLSTEVTQISWPQAPDAKVFVTCKDGTVYSATNVIVTVSLGVLKERYRTLFNPPLPAAKTTAIEKMSMGLLNKIILIFPYQWWEGGNSANYLLLWREEDKMKVLPEDRWVTKLVGLSSSMGNNVTLTMWTSGNTGKLVELIPEEVVKTKCVEVIRQFMGSNITVPDATGIIRTRWFSNRYSRGSYSYDNLLADGNARPNLAQPLTDSAGKPRVLFAGEATNEKHFATVHGAAETGYREAMKLLQ